MRVDALNTRGTLVQADVSLQELSVGEALREAAAAEPDRLAVIDPASGRRLTYVELLAQSERVAHGLLERFSPGEHVAACMPNLPEFLLLQFGAALAGMVLVPVPPALRGRDLAHVLRTSHAAGVFFSPEFRDASLTELIAQLRAELPELREAVSLEGWSAFLATAPVDGELPEVDPADPSQIQFTSGSTGAPKGAVLHHRGILNCARFAAADLELGRDDVWLACLPLCYIAGCAITVVAALQARATLVLCDFDPGLVLSLIESERATVILLAAAMVQMLLEHEDFSRRDLSSLRLVSVGGSAIAPELAREAQAALGVPLTVMYGLTEACGIVAQTRIDDPEKDRVQTIGRPHPHVEIKIIDPWRGVEVPAGAVGQLLVRGYFVMNGYLDLPEATRPPMRRAARPIQTPPPLDLPRRDATDTLRQSPQAHTPRHLRRSPRRNERALWRFISVCRALEPRRATTCVARWRAPLPVRAAGPHRSRRSPLVWDGPLVSRDHAPVGGK